MEIDPKALEAAMHDVKRFRFRTDSTIDDFVFMTAQAAITAYKRAREAQGYVEVPVEPTPKMVAKALPIVDQPPDHMTARIAERALFMVEPTGS